MKPYQLLLLASFIFLHFSCETVKNKRLANSSKDTVKEDCLVSRTVQTDAFLKGIKELQNYTWNDTEKEAALELPNGEKLTITHGGCIHFLAAAEFHTPTPIRFENDSMYIFKRVLWITKLLKDFKYPQLKEAIKKGNYQKIKNKHITTLTFTDKALQEKFYAITINTKEQTFSVSQFLE